MNQVAVLGAGAWGTALALHAASNGDRVRLWAYPADQAQELQRSRTNPLLDGFVLSDRVEVLADLDQTVRDAEIVILALPSQVLRETLRRAAPSLPAAAPVISATKGIEDGSLMLMDEVIADVLGQSARGRLAVLSGPSFAREVALGMPTNLVLAARDLRLAEALRQKLATDRFRIYPSDDVPGTEVGGALKNVVAIAAGASDGLGFGNNTRAALITRGLAEIARLAQAKGGQILSVSGLAGLGDLVLTCTGDLSRNRTVGFELGCGKRLSEVLNALGHVAEGVSTAKNAHELAQKLGVELPICEQVYRVLFHGKSPADAVQDLLQRPSKREWR